MCLELFDRMVYPIILYGSEVWGANHMELFEKLLIQFCRLLLKCNKSTPKCMIYGELGILPLQCRIDSRVVNYWF